MKWLRTITGVAENIVSMFRQVDTLIQRIHNRQYIAKVTYQNGVYKINVVDREGNAVDGAIVLVYLRQQGVYISATAGYVAMALSETAYSHQKVLWHDITFGDQTTRKSMVVLIPAEGCKFQIFGNNLAKLKACVLGVE